MASQTDITHARPTFASIVCGVDGSRPSREAARQAALLADDGAALTYAAVSWEQGTGATAVATLSHRHARECLQQARRTRGSSASSRPSSMTTPRTPPGD